MLQIEMNRNEFGTIGYIRYSGTNIYAVHGSTYQDVMKKCSIKLDEFLTNLYFYGV